MNLIKPLIVVVLILTMAGCQSTYYKTMETFGYHKRDLLVSRVQDARNAQADARDQFQSALEKFSAIVDFSGGKLEKKYKQLKSELDKSEAGAKEVGERISDVEKVAKALFKEWESELEHYSSGNLRDTSSRKLKQTRQRYARLIDTMRRAKSKIAPVLASFRDQVLFLKHNLNAQAIASLQGELASVEADIASLIREIETSIAEADTFIKAMGRE
jgi:hypothetical protein